MSRRVARRNESLRIALGLLLAIRRGDSRGVAELFDSLDDERMVEVFGAMSGLAASSRHTDDQLKGLAFDLTAEGWE